jgi:Mn-dependent DtxR family transcriptional regulator
MVLKLDKETMDQLTALIDKIVQDKVEEKLEELLNDPDEGLEVKQEIIENLRLQKISKNKRIPFAEIAKEYGFKLQ